VFSHRKREARHRFVEELIEATPDAHETWQETATTWQQSTKGE
jgi:hypothetical protein